MSPKFCVDKDRWGSLCSSSQALMRLAARALNDMHLFCRKSTIFKTETNSASQTPDQSDLASRTKDNTIILEFSIKREEGIYKKSRKLIKGGELSYWSVFGHWLHLWLDYHKLFRKVAFVPALEWRKGRNQTRFKPIWSLINTDFF